MSQTAQLDLPLIAQGQTNKHATANEAFAALEATVTAQYEATLTTTADHTLTYDPDEGGNKTGLQALRYKFNGTPGGGVNVIHPNKKHLAFVFNNTDQNIVFKTAAGTGPTIAAGNHRLVYCDGTNITEIGVSAVVPSLNSITDVNCPAPTDGTILMWDGVALEWVPFSANQGEILVWLNGALQPILPNHMSTSSATTYNPVITDLNGVKVMTAPTAIGVVLPLDATLDFPIGTKLSYIQGNTGQITISGAVGVTVNVSDIFEPKSLGRYALITALKTAADEWMLYGTLELVVV